MKIVCVFAVLLLAACASRPSLEQLETQASQTGDWSAVEKRERSLQRMRMRAGTQCPDGYFNFCEGVTGTEHCACVNARTMGNAFVGR